MMPYEELLDRIAEGGPLMVPLALVSLAAWTLVAERWFWLRRQKDPGRRLKGILAHVDRGDLEAAVETCRDDGSISLRAVARFLSGLSSAVPGAAPHLAREASLREFAAARRSLAALATLAAVAPLLGLLGTVFGMIDTFDAITVHGTGNPRLLAEGVSEALLTTQAGLVVALPVLLAHGWLKRRCLRVERLAEEALALVVNAARAGAGRNGLRPAGGGIPEGGKA